MNKAVYDTRFFADSYYSKDESLLKKIRAHKARKRYVSAIVVHEIYKLTLAREGRETAKLRVALLIKDFKVIPVDDQIAQASA